MKSKKYRMKMLRRFLDKCDRSGDCWNWTGATHKDGYGMIGVPDRVELAHRVSVELLGVVPGDFHVLHRCDNPRCVRPSHLFLGTNRDNVKDKLSKKRGSTRFTKELVGQVKRALRFGMEQRSIAHLLGVHQSAVSRINTGKSLTWLQ